MKLWQIAHVRTGDKGNISNVSVTVYDTKDFNLVRDKLTPEFVKNWYASKYNFPFTDHFFISFLL